jgi:hypothetical protein
LVVAFLVAFQGEASLVGAESKILCCYIVANCYIIL